MAPVVPKHEPAWRTAMLARLRASWGSTVAAPALVHADGPEAPHLRPSMAAGEGTRVGAIAKQLQLPAACTAAPAAKRRRLMSKQPGPAAVAMPT